MKTHVWHFECFEEAFAQFFELQAQSVIFFSHRTSFLLYLFILIFYLIYLLLLEPLIFDWTQT